MLYLNLGDEVKLLVHVDVIPFIIYLFCIRSAILNQGPPLSPGSKTPFFPITHNTGQSWQANTFSSTLSLFQMNTSSCISYASPI